MKVQGTVHKFGSNVDTDVIIPARYLNTSSPEELALVGFATEPFCHLLPTPPSSVDQFSYKMGYMAGQMMFDRLSGEPQVGVVIAPELIIRKSSLKNSK